MIGACDVITSRRFHDLSGFWFQVSGYERWLVRVNRPMNKLTVGSRQLTAGEGAALMNGPCGLKGYRSLQRVSGFWFQVSRYESRVVRVNRPLNKLTVGS